MFESAEKYQRRWANVHPDFDGHLSKRVQDMTYAERLQWIEEGMRLLLLQSGAQSAEG